LNPSAL